MHSGVVSRSLCAADSQGILKKFEEEHGIPDPLSYNLVLRAYAKDGNYKDAVEWMGHMETKGKATVCSHSPAEQETNKDAKLPTNNFGQVQELIRNHNSW